jgi:Protein of unknown function (DUF1524)
MPWIKYLPHKSTKFCTIAGMDTERRRRVGIVLLLMLIIAISAIVIGVQQWYDARTVTTTLPTIPKNTILANDALATLPIKGRAPRTDYAREQFGAGWAEIDGCDMRNYILQRDLENIRLSTDNCIVLSGILNDPYTGNRIEFTRGMDTSSDVQIDHVVALSDAWQKGAQQMDEAERAQFANDPLNLLAVDGPANQQKSDADAASWLPPNKDYRCRYVARQIAVKRDYDLWVTEAEHDAMERVLSRCPSQVLPITLIKNPK